MTRQGYRRIEFVLDISADPRDAEIGDILASLPNLARSEFIRCAIYAYAHAPAEAVSANDLADSIDQLWRDSEQRREEIKALRAELEWLRSRPAAVPAQPAPVVAPSSGLNMGGPRKSLKPGQGAVEVAEVDSDGAREALLKSINGFSKQQSP